MQKSKLITIRDVSDQKKCKEIDHSKKLSEAIIAITSHGIRTPLNTIMNILKMLERKLKD